MKAFKFVLIFFVMCFGTCLSTQQTTRQWNQPSTVKATTAVVDNSDRPKRSHDAIYNRWLDILAQYGRREDQGTLWAPFPVDLPVGNALSGDGRPSLLPVLVLPIPVPYPSSKGECDTNNGQTTKVNNRSGPEDGRLDVRIGDIFDNDDLEQPQVNKGTVSSNYLVELFRQQNPQNPELPPAVFDDYAPQIIQPSLFNTRGYGLNAKRDYLPPTREALSPPVPRFDKSTLVKGFLTVLKSDYTEAYTAMYDANTGSSRVEYHDHAAMSLRVMSNDGSVQRFVRHTDRLTNQDIRVCGVTSAWPALQEDRMPPVLPNTDGFTFGGYREEYGTRVEVWHREIQGGVGQLGAVRGETLTYRHELIVARRGENATVPLKYNVWVDSTLLGHECDSYEHVYTEVREKEHDMNIFRFDPARECEQQESLSPANAGHMARLEPLREFIQPYRDPRYDETFDKYQKEFERTYSDNKEAAMRKTILIQKNRFISSCNRQSGTFSLAVNFLSDRLEKEIDVLLGAVYSDEFEKDAKLFPISGDRLQELEGNLPKEFDWRPRGAVSPIKFQGASCSSCWAFAVVGSVEGALFIRTSKLTELSEQTLVDCGHTHGCHGCNGTWPAAAFKYVTDRGLPARAEYTPYKERVLRCRAPPVPPVTHIDAFFDVTPNDIDALKVAIRQFAPAVVVVDAKCQTFIHYKKGVLHDDRCIKSPKKKLNHAVLAVGWGELRNDPYFIIKNSWSAMWGEGGYISLHSPSNTCGHLTTPNYPRLYTRNIDKLPPGAREYHESDGLDASDSERR